VWCRHCAWVGWASEIERDEGKVCPSTLYPQLFFAGFPLEGLLIGIIPLAKALAEKKVHVRGSKKVMLCGQSWDHSYRKDAVTELELESLPAPPPLLTTFIRQTHRSLSTSLLCSSHQDTRHTMGECTGSRQSEPPTNLNPSHLFTLLSQFVVLIQIRVDGYE